MDVILIHSPIILYNNEAEKKQFAGHGGDEKSIEPMSVLYLAAYLEEKGHSVKIIDVSAEGMILPDILRIIDDKKPKVVGISSMTASIASSVTLAKLLKERYKDNALIGLGGVHLCCDPTFLDRFPVFDFGVIGEGEKTLEDIVRRAKAGEKIRGLFKGEPAQNLDELPFPARHLINPKIYLRDEQMKFEMPAAGILGSRGCPYRCSFCCIPAIGHKVRLRSPKNIVDEMASVYEQCRGSYSFIDDCLTLNRNHTLAFCQEIIDRKMKVRWIGATRASALDEEVVKALKKAGCTDVYLGVESGNERIRNEIIKKKVTDEQIAKAVYLCRKHRILTNLYLMVGFPTETKREMMDTVNIGSRVKADIVGIHITVPLPGAEIFNYAVQNKMIPADIIDRYASGRMGKGFRGVWPLFIPAGFTLKDLVDIKRKTYTGFYLNPMWWARRVRTWFIIPRKFKEDLKLFKIAFYVFMTGGTKGQLS